MKKITKEVYIKWYKDMLFWRKFEEKASALYIQQKIRGFLHLYIGQEAIAAGARYLIDPKKDSMISAYRCHVQALSMGVDGKKVMAELMGKSTGTSKGKGGSMHIFSKKHNYYGGHGIVGGQIPLGAGIAFANKYYDRKAVNLTFMGDGAARQGSFHETLNMSANWKLPVVFIIENNGYSMGTSVDRTSNVTDMYKMGEGYDIPCLQVDGMCPQKVAEGLDEPINRARRGDGPSLIEIKTYRYKGHSMSDAQLYRTKDEVAEYQKIDPIIQVKKKIEKDKLLTEKDFEKIDNDIKIQIKECVDFAENSPYPSPKELFEDSYYQKDFPFTK